MHVVVPFSGDITRYPFLREGLPDHADEVRRIAERLVVAENEPVVVPELPDDAPAWEKRYWARRSLGTCECGRPIMRGTGNSSTKCGPCATAGLRYEDGLR